MPWSMLARGCLILGTLLVSLSAAPASELSPLLDTLRKVDREGKGHREATQAWGRLTSYATADQLPEMLSAMDNAEPLAANWLRAAVDAVAERELRSGKLPTDGLQKFLDTKQHNPRARRLAFEWIVRADPTASRRLIPTMLDDPALELRRDAVAEVLAAADAELAANKNDAALVTYQKALSSARDLDQVKAAAEALKKLGKPVDLSHHFGFIADWKILGPFPNPSGKGFDTEYEPEKKLDLKASYQGPEGALNWVDHHTDDEYGNVDLNKAIGKHKDAILYCAAEFQSDKARPIEVRSGSQNAVKVWLNGKLLTSADVYHANDTIDQYAGRGQLQAGRNVILIKVCQNNQTEDWAQEWKFQLRVCDELGKAVLSTDRPGPRVAQQAAAKPSNLTE